MDRMQETRPSETAWSPDAAAAQRLYREVEEQLTLPLQATTVDAVSAVLCTLSQRLSGGEAQNFAATLPREVQLFLQRWPRHRAERPDRFGVAGFIERVAEHLRIPTAEAEAITRAVFAVVHRWLPPKEVRDVASQLPADLRELWLSPLDAPPATVGPPNPDDVPPPDGLAMKVLEEVRHALPPGLNEREVLMSVLCTLCQRLSAGEARELVKALPPGLRPLVEGSTQVRAEEPEIFDREELLRRVARSFDTDLDQAEAMARLVFTAIERVVPPRQIRHVASQLPGDLRELWTDNSVAAARGPGRAERA